MMELGATVCLKHKPLCTVCPVLKFCVAHKHGTQNGLPKIERKTIVQVEIDRAWVIEDAKLLLHHIPDSAGQLAGQYELPELSVVKARTSPQLIASKSRSITHRRIKEYIYETVVASINNSLEWVALNELDNITLSGPHRRWIRELLKDR
jgi:A/G-specific adenine glycosylase